jgi:threonylcarbamoyladenosine tRNA methylthiotransferase MtaB
LLIYDIISLPKKFGSVFICIIIIVFIKELKMKVFFYTLGCKVNQYETQEMIELFEKEGHTIINKSLGADICIINSCTVTAESVRKTRQTIRKLKKQNPDSIIILTGCASQAEPHIINDLPEVDILMGNRSNSSVINALNTFLESKEFCNNYIEHKTGDTFCGTGISRFDGHTRAFLKIQDGCDRFCSYCLIPMARGRSRSKALEEIDIELKRLSENGYKEIVFVGINLSDFGKNTPYSLPDALMLAEKYPEIERVRLGSLEPDHITDEMIAKLKQVKKLCPQFHISVQSGCNNVLKAMNRHYTAEEYEELANKLRNTFKDTTITTDVLVGFPTETDDDFKTTCNFVKSICFEKVHVFPYSVREGTRAEKMEQLTKAVKENRAFVLSKITSKSTIFEISLKSFTLYGAG